MDSTVVTLAKSFCQFETKDLNEIFTSSETPALVMLSKYISTPKLSEYINSQAVTYSSTEVGSEQYLTLLHINYSDNLSDGDMINIPTTDQDPKVYTGNYVVENLDTENLTLEIRKTFSVNESGLIINKSDDDVLYANAYFILYLVAHHSQSIVKNDVIYSSQQFGQGNMSPASQSEKKLLCDRYKQQALSYLGRSFNFMVV
jgi:hypothetical protein